MRLDQVAVATMTLARDEAEEGRLRGSLTALARAGLPTFVADGGSRPALVGFIDSLPGMTCATAVEPGLLGQIKASLHAARGSGAGYILYTEPDKRSFFEHQLLDFLVQARRSQAALAIAARSADSFATFPDTQRLTEEMANRLLESCTGSGGDYFYGPFLMRSDLAEYLHLLPAAAGWGWRPFLFMLAHRRRLTTVHLTGDFPCPADQRQEDDAGRIHRMRQLAQNVGGIAQGMTAALGGGAADCR
jgi:hypothetical protein